MAPRVAYPSARSQPCATCSGEKDSETSEWPHRVLESSLDQLLSTFYPLTLQRASWEAMPLSPQVWGPREQIRGMGTCGLLNREINSSESMT